MKSISQKLFNQADQNREKVALIIEGEQITYGRLVFGINKRKNELLNKLGSIEGKPIVLYFGNGLSFVEWFYAIVELQGIVIPFPSQLTKRELHMYVERFTPYAIVSELGVNKIEQNETIFLKDKNVISLLDQPFYVSLSSGSTGLPKGIIRTQRSWLNSFDCMTSSFRLTNKDILLLPGPLYYSASLIALLHLLSLGGTVFLLKKFSHEKVIDALPTVTTAFMVPTMYQLIIDTIKLSDKKYEGLQSLITAGAKMNGGLKRDIKNRFPKAVLFEYFGSAEQGFISFITSNDPLEKQHTVGKVFPHVELMFEGGTIFVKSPYTFLSYWGSEEILQERWVTVGDHGFLDSEGYLNYQGRKESMMISGGINVYPLEIEAVLKELPEIQEVCVFGILDETWGEKIVAVIQANAGIREELESHVRANLSSPKRPRTFIFVKQIPKTKNGKIDLQTIRNQLK